MKYTIETTEYGCIETLEFSDGSKFTKRHKRTENGCDAMDKPFRTQLLMDGFCEEIVDLVDENFDSFLPLHFLELVELDN